MSSEKIHDEILREAIHEKPSKPPSKLKIVLFSLVSVVLLAFLSLYFIFAPIAHVVKGNLHSETLVQDSLSFKDFTIVFQGESNVLLSEIFKQEQLVLKKETSVCLQGEKKGSTYYVQSLFYPTIFDQSLTHVSFSSCPNDSLIMLHTHPFGNCLASQTDKDTLKRRQATNPDTLMIIMCGENTYAAYS